MASRLVLNPEAFSINGRGQRRPREKQKSHLEFIARLPCLVCGRRMNVQAAHLRVGNALYGKPHTGLQEKSSDRWALPLCAKHHAEQHAGNELHFWWRLRKIPDPWTMALILWGLTGDVDNAEVVIELWRTKGGS